MTSSEKNNARSIESKKLDPTRVEQELEQAREAANKEVEAGRATTHYEFRDGIRDGDHLSHLTITTTDGVILYDQDFDLEDAEIARDEWELMQLEQKKLPKN